MIERQGHDGMLATSGFRDILDMGLERRYNLFDLEFLRPAAGAARSCASRSPSGLGFDGAGRTRPAIDEAARRSSSGAGRAAGRPGRRRLLPACLRQSGARGAGAGGILRERSRGTFVSASADVFPNMREFERWTTTPSTPTRSPCSTATSSGWRGPGVAGFGGRLYIMASSGGAQGPKPRAASRCARSSPARPPAC